jgi:hypothetical protein
MKKMVKPMVFSAIFIICLFVINTGCKKKADCSGAEALCGSHTFTACCTESDCYYVVDDDVQYDCNGLDCYAAASDMINDYCAGGVNFSKEQALALVEKVLKAIK